MKIQGPSWHPTATLAKLFEEQNQFYDALATYELIAQTDSSAEIRQKIEELHTHILNDPANRYDPRIDKLFSPEELAYLKIISHQGFENFARTQEKLQEGYSASELVFEDEEVLAEEAELDALSAMLAEIEQQAQLNVIENSGEFKDLTIGDVLISILSRYDRQQKLSEVTLSDFVSLFLDFKRN